MGSMELQSTTVLPWPRPGGHAVFAEQHLSTSGVSGTIRKTMSARSATPRAVVQTVAPPSASAGGGAVRVDEQHVAGVQQVARHGRAHDAQADEADLVR